MGNGNTKTASFRRVMTAKLRFRELLGIWNSDRADREHWKDILREAPSKVYKRRLELLEGKEEEELIERFTELLQGHVPENGELKASKEICVFLSSTFSDMGTERNLLMEDVYPYLRALSRKLGYSFNVSDMRWGVRDEMTDEHQAVEICTTEIQRCR